MKNIEIKVIRKELKKLRWNIKTETFSWGKHSTVFSIEKPSLTLGGIFPNKTAHTHHGVEKVNDYIDSLGEFTLVDLDGDRIIKGGF